LSGGKTIMKEFLYKIIEWIAEIHSYLMRINDSYEYHFSDKELHFIVIGLLGMLFIFIVYPVFKWLAKHNHVMVIAWIYVFTLILVITFAIEIGQKVTNTGAMEFADIVFGVVGFIVMFFIFSVVREIYHLIGKLIKYLQQKNK
jgi:glycopeptide antibiotics resistance protein